MATATFIKWLLLKLCFTGIGNDPGLTPDTVNLETLKAKCASSFQKTMWYDSGVIRENLNGRKLRLGVYNRDPFYSHVNRSGVVVDIIDILAKELNFTYELIIPPDVQMVGMPSEVTGTTGFNGLMGLVERKEVDMTASFVSLIPERRQVADFSTMIGEEKWVVLMRRPRATTSGDGLVAPFETDVWILVGIALVVMGPIIFAIIWIRVKICKGDPKLSNLYSLPQCIWFVYGALMKQGSILNPISDSTRVLFATWWIYVTILTSFYTANLTAYLTLSKVWLPIEDVKQLNKRSAHWVGVKGDALEYAINTDNNINYLKKQISRGRYKYVDKDVEALEYVDGSGYYFLTEREMADRLIFHDYVRLIKDQAVAGKDKRCRFIRTYKTFLTMGYAYAFPKGSDLPQKINPILMRLVEAGVHTHFRSLDLADSDPCNVRGSFSERRLLNSDLSTTYIVTSVGYAIAGSVWILELLHKYLWRGKIRPLKEDPNVVKVGKQDAGQKGASFMKSNLDTFFKAGGGPVPDPNNKTGYFDTERFLRTINGRDYMVLKTSDGRTRLLPVDPNDPRAAEAAMAPAKPQYGFQGYLS